MNRFYVYVIFRPNGIPCYVGKGEGWRWSRHATRARNPILFAIYQKAGGDLPIVRVRDGITEAEAFETEIALIAAIGRKPNGPLVNLTDGGDGAKGLRHTPEFRAQVSARFKGKKLSPEAIANAVEGRRRLDAMATPEEYRRLHPGNTGPRSKEVRRKISLTHKAKGSTPPSRKGTTTPPEVRRKQSAGARRYWAKPPKGQSDLFD